jgi:hypothetical protein
MVGLVGLVFFGFGLFWLVVGARCFFPFVGVVSRLKTKTNFFFFFFLLSPVVKHARVRRLQVDPQSPRARRQDVHEHVRPGPVERLEVDHALDAVGAAVEAVVRLVFDWFSIGCRFLCLFFCFLFFLDLVVVSGLFDLVILGVV